MVKKISRSVVSGAGESVYDSAGSSVYESANSSVYDGVYETASDSASASESATVTGNRHVYQDNYCEIVSYGDRFTFIEKRKNNVTQVIANYIEKHNDEGLLFYKCEYLDDFLMKHRERKLSIDVATHFARCLTEQSDMLNEKNKAIFCLTLDCIVVINGRFPVFIDSNFITDIKKDDVVSSVARHATDGGMFSLSMFH